MKILSILMLLSGSVQLYTLLSNIFYDFVYISCLLISFFNIFFGLLTITDIVKSILNIHVFRIVFTLLILIITIIIKIQTNNEYYIKYVLFLFIEYIITIIETFLFIDLSCEDGYYFKDIKYILVGKNDYENQGQIIKFIIVFNQDINIFDCILFNDWKNLLDFNDSNFTLREPCINNDNFLIQFIGLKNKYSFDIIKRMILKMNIKYINTDIENISIVDN